MVSYKHKTRKNFPCGKTWSTLYSVLSLCNAVGGTIFAGYVPVASQNPYLFIVYFMANNIMIPHLSHFWVNAILVTPT